MKTLLLLISFCMFTQFAYTNIHIVSELKHIDGKWNIELIHNPNLKIDKLQLLVKDVYRKNIDTADIKQIVIDSLNKQNSIVVLTKNDLLTEISESNSIMSYTIIINDTIEDNISKICSCQNDESILIIDSATMNQNMIPYPDSEFDYYGIGLSSLGKPNKKEDAFAILKGTLRRRSDNSILRNAKFHLEQKFWDPLTGRSDTLKTDENGFFSLATWPAICYYYSLEKHLQIHIFNVTFDTEFAIIPTFDSLRPGIQDIELIEIGVNLASIKAATLLRLSPNPASATLQASYTLPSELIPAKTVLQISNLQGEALQNIALDAAEGLVTISLPVKMSNGTYFCSVLSNGVVYKTVQFMVQR